MTVLAVLDVETTGEDPSRHSVAEIALVWLELLRGGDTRLLRWSTSLARVREELDPTIRAVHHLHPARLRRARPAATVLLHLWRPGVQGAASHWAEFDFGFVGPLARGLRLDLPPLLCTHRLSRHLVPDAPSHKLQALRYLIDLRVRPPGWAHPHRALHDALVAAELLRWELRELRGDLAEAVRLSSAPVLLPEIKFGQHRGTAWPHIPGSYLRWMRREVDRDGSAFDLDTRYTLDAELARRNRPRSAPNPRREERPHEARLVPEQVHPRSEEVGAEPVPEAQPGRLQLQQEGGQD